MQIDITMDPKNQMNDHAQPSLRVLVVDDREDVTMSLALLLRKLGHNVQVAYKAQEAMRKGEDFHPDIIFLDIGLPDRSGYDVCKDIRQSDWGHASFIVALTGRNEAEDMIRAAHTGFDRHVGKPMSLPTLQEILHTVGIRVASGEAQAVAGEDRNR